MPYSNPVPELKVLRTPDSELLRRDGARPKSTALSPIALPDNCKLEIEARRIGELQRSLLPHPLPQISGLEIAATYQPCGHAGGDLYDFFPLDGPGPYSRWCLFVGDAAGHGLAAAMVIAMAHSILHARPKSCRGAADLLVHLNRHLCRKRICSFITSFLGVYDPRTRQLDYSCAGHPPPLLKDATNGRIVRLDAVGGRPIGILEDEIYLDSSIALGLGDTLLLYTDGITEARDPCGDLFSEERLVAAFDECTKHPTEVIEQLEGCISAYRRGHRVTDDVVLVAVTGK